MPDLSTNLHLDMYQKWVKKRAGDEGGNRRVGPGDVTGAAEGELYGLHWGDPDNLPPLMFIKNEYVLPHVGPDVDALEIGPGGGRWTRYLLPCRSVWLVDFHEEILDLVRQTFGEHDNLEFVHNTGSDFPGVPDESIDFLYSFGTFVHLDEPLVDSYLDNMRRILRPDATVVIQYSDKRKPMCARNKGFADMVPDRMRELLAQHGYRITGEDEWTMWHSSLVQFTPG